MQVSLQSKFAVPWASSAATSGGPNGDGYVRTVSQTSLIGTTGKSGYASFADGFVPINATPVGAGGIPPYIQDMNGILNAITTWDRWTQAGGPIYFDQTFATAIGGYPAGAMVQCDASESAANAGIVWQSSVDNNKTDPDSSSAAGWVAKSVVTSSVKCLARDAVGNGGIVSLAGSNGAATVNMDNYTNTWRVFSTASNILTYNYTTGLLTAPSITSVGNLTAANVSSVAYEAKPDSSSDRVYYFVDANGRETGHFYQSHDGVVEAAGTVNGGPYPAAVTANGTIYLKATGPTGGTQGVSFDTAGGFTTWAIYAASTACAISGFQSIQTSAAGGITAGTAGVTSAGPVLANSQFNLYGSNFTMYGSPASNGSRATTAQLVYNAVTPVTNGPQTEIWNGTCTVWLDSVANLYVRSGYGTSNAKTTQVMLVGGSARAIKQDIVPLTGVLGALKAAPPIRFRYNELSGEDTDTHRVGNLYEEVAVAMPEASTVIGGDGKVDQRYIVPYLHSAVLELTARVEALEARLGGAA